MALCQFCRNAIALIDDREHTLRQEVEAGIWQLEDSKTGRLKEYTITQLQEMYAVGELLFPKDHSQTDLVKLAKGKSRTNQREVKQELWDEAKSRLAYVKAVLDLPGTKSLIKSAITKLHEQIGSNDKPPHWNTVLRWRKQFISHSKDAFALVSQIHNKGNRKSRYPKELIELVQDVIEQKYMVRERPTIHDVLDEAITAVDDANKQKLASQQLPQPTRRLLTRMIEQIPSYDRCVARYGRIAANHIFRSKTKHVVTHRPLELVEMDHTRLDIFVIDDKSHLPLGRPWITIAIDSHTRCIMGISIGFEPPSYLSVGKCLKHAILPKTQLQRDYPEINHEWAAHGVMDKLVVDNGLEFHSLSLEQACLAFGIELVFTPRKSPWFKGKIERFNGTLNRSACHVIAGTTFSNIFDKQDYDPAKHAVLTLDKLRLVIHKWIVDYYHQKPHRGLEGQAPAIAWSNSIKPEDIQLAHNPAEIEILLGKTVEQKVVTHKGIEINNLLYNSAELMQIRRQRGDTFNVDIRIDESDIGYVYAMLGPQNYLKVPALDHEAHGISLWLHKVFRNYAKTKIGKINPVTYARAKVEIRQIVEETMQLKHKKANNRVGRYRDNTKNITSAPTKPKNIMNGQLPVSTTPFSELPVTVPKRYTPIMQPRH